MTGTVLRGRSLKKAKKVANASVYFSVLVLIASIASIGYKPPTDVVSVAGTTQAANEVTRPSVDQVAVASLAARTAEVAGLSVTNEVTNMSITMDVKSQLTQSDEAVITKPQVFEPASSSALLSYKAIAGDTVPSVAVRYGITPDTLKWANNLVTDNLVPGTDLTVPAADGVVYTTKDGDTLDGVAQKYQADKARIVSKNNLELTGIVAGRRILLPGGTLPANERPGYVAPRTINVSTPVTGVVAARAINPMFAAQAGNKYSYGYCTWYAYNRRAQLGRPIGSFWGNASSWAYAAAAAGYTVTRGNPDVGDVMQNGGGAGHVAVVEEKHADGSIRVSEMNYYANGGGWGVISYRDVDRGGVLSYTFIK